MTKNSFEGPKVSFTEADEVAARAKAEAAGEDPEAAVEAGRAKMEVATTRLLEKQREERIKAQEPARKRAIDSLKKDLENMIP